MELPGRKSFNKGRKTLIWTVYESELVAPKKKTFHHERKVHLDYFTYFSNVMFLETQGDGSFASFF